jgi:hypothetical protein
MNGNFNEECRRAMKGFSIAYQRLKNKQLDAEIAYIDCKKHLHLCEGQLKTFSYPTTKYIVRKQVVDIPMKGRTQALVIQSILDYVNNPGTSIKNYT